MEESKLKIEDFRNAVSSIIEFLEYKYPQEKSAPPSAQQLESQKPWRRSKLHVSDVIDCNGSQYVDLVQEGGGVHGIALAGYTYVLEKMGIAFTKMAATSAGSINALLLSAVTTKNELLWMQHKYKDHTPAKNWQIKERYNPDKLDPEKCFETRSEKMLEYLSDKDLSEFVDGHKSWRDLILRTFRGQVKFDNIKKYFRKVGKWGLFTVIMLVILLLSGVFLVFLIGDSWVHLTFRWISALSTAGFITGICFMIRQAVGARLLYKHAERFGINPGKDFEGWLNDKLKENGIENVAQLKNKLQLEQSSLAPQYVPIIPPSKLTNEESLNKPATRQIFSKLKALKKEMQSFVKGDQLQEGETPEERLDQLYTKITRISKDLLPEDPDKEEIASELVELLIDLNKMQIKMIDDDKTDDSNLSSAFKKELAIVSSDVTNEMKAEFPAMHKMYWGANYMTVSPAKYVRASMSIPGFFKPFQIDYDLSQKFIIEKEWRELLNIDLRLQEKDKFALMMDGGMLSNFPVNIFYNGETPLPYKPTVGVKLEFEDDATSNYIESDMQMVGAMISTMRYFYDRDFISKHNIFKKTVRSIDTGEIHWLNFAMTDDEKIKLFFRGALTAAIFLIGAEDDNTRAECVQHLIQMGKIVPFPGEKTQSIYSDDVLCTFLTEDNSVNDVSFNWSQYRIERILMLGEQNATRNRLKQKAGFSNKSKDPGESTSI